MDRQDPHVRRGLSFGCIVVGMTQGRSLGSRVWQSHVAAVVGLPYPLIQEMIKHGVFPEGKKTPKSRWWWHLELMEWLEKNEPMAQALRKFPKVYTEGVNVTPSLFAGIKVELYELCLIEKTQPEVFIHHAIGARRPKEIERGVYPPPDSPGGWDGDPKRWWWDGESLISSIAETLGPNDYEEDLGQKYVPNWTSHKLIAMLVKVGLDPSEYLKYVEATCR